MNIRQRLTRPYFHKVTMSIQHVRGSGSISDQGGQSHDQFSDDSAGAEEQILEFLLEHFGLVEFQARMVLASLIRSGEDIRVLALGIQNGDDSAIDQVELFIA